MKNSGKFFASLLVVLLVAYAAAFQFHFRHQVRDGLVALIAVDLLALVVSVIRSYPRWRWVVIVPLAGASWAGFVKFGEARRTAQDKSVATYRLHADASQFFVENPQRVFVNFDEIVGPGAPSKSVNPVAGEDYRTMFPLRRDLETMPVTMGDGRQVIVFTDRQTVYVSPRGEATGPGATAYRELLEANRRRDGVQVLRLGDGRRFETTWRSGVEEGPFLAYYQTGELWAEATYVAGRPVGRHVVYDRAGKIIHATTFGPRK